MRIEEGREFEHVIHLHNTAFSIYIPKFHTGQTILKHFAIIPIALSSRGSSNVTVVDG